MKMKNIISFMLLALLAGACSKDEIMLFDRDEAGVYFQASWKTSSYATSERYTDSTEYSFSIVSDTVTEVIVDTRIRTLGKVKDYPRPVKVSVDAEHTTAIEGIHYEADFDAAVIPAGKSSVSFPVKFFRTADLEGHKFRLMLKLEDNDYFKVYFNEQRNTSVYYATGEQVMADRYLFIVSEIYTEPSYWYYAEGTFGVWTVAKFRFINKICGLSVEDWDRGGASDSKVHSGRFPIFGYMVRNALQELADAGTPVLDDNGDYMQLSPLYEVDYSDYVK